MARKKVTEPVIQGTYSRSSTPELKTEASDTSFTTRTPSTPKVTPKKRRARRSSLKDVDPPNSFFTDAITNVFTSIFSFIGEIITNTISLIKKPLSYLFVLYLLAVIIALAYNFLTTSISTALLPICKIPGVSFLDIPFCDYVSSPNHRKPGKTDFPELINLQSNFERILENSVGGSSMALDLKNSEIAVRDLTTLVRVSELLCREDLSARLDDFVQTAKLTSRGLTRFGSRVNGVVDSLLAMDEYALRSLEKARISQLSASSNNVITAWALAPFKPWNAIPEAERDILATFVQASNVMDNSIQRLIIEAEAVLRDLDDLENRLHLIQDMVSREDSVIKEQHNEILAELWTILGGNRKKLANFASHRTLLTNIAMYRSKALAHVSASLIQLQQMQSDLEDLRDRVAAPALLADVGKDVQDIPLEVHIESIRKGVERLDSGRKKAKGVENAYMKKMLSMHDAAMKVLELDTGGE